jgi:hypothetical protein
MLYEKNTKKEQIMRLYKAGKSQVQIARELRTYTQYVCKVVNENKTDK